MVGQPALHLSTILLVLCIRIILKHAPPANYRPVRGIGADSVMAAKAPQATAICSEVEQAWLEAGQRGDTKTMEKLFNTHPKWLALDRVRTAIIEVANVTSVYYSCPPVSSDC